MRTSTALKYAGLMAAILPATTLTTSIPDANARQRSLVKHPESYATGQTGVKPPKSTGEATPQPDAAPTPKAAEVEADEMQYREADAIVIAKGNATIHYDDRTLLADEVTYNQNTRLITASGTVNLKDAPGNSFFADHLSVNDQLTAGEFTHMNGKLADGALIAADKGIRQSKDVTVLENAVYSPCSVCPREHNGKALWAVAADKVTLDDAEKRVTYNHATFNVYGIPVMYTPYFSHYMPGSGRQSGFLIPTYSHISTLGSTVSMPVYLNLAPNMDATLTPILTSNEGHILSGDFRRLTSNGAFELGGSITNPVELNGAGQHINGHELRGHVEGAGLFHLNDLWSWGFDGKRASDDTYLQRYKFGDETVLTSRAFAQKLEGNNYLGAQTISFQGLTASSNAATSPLILPLLSAHYEKPTEFHNSRITLESNAMALSRDVGVDSRRFSSTLGWVMPYVSEGGHLFTLKTSLRGDVYSVSNVVTPGGTVEDGGVGRAIPEAQLNWSFPLARSIESARVFIEPLADFIASPNGGNPDKIPNEDSQQTELSDINLFSNNHYTGLDRVEGGLRTNYGFRGGVNHTLGAVDFLLGQSYRTKEDKNFTPETGLSQQFSDYAGRVSVKKSHAAVTYRFRADKENFTLHHNEIDLNINYDRVSAGIGYVAVNENNNNFNSKEATGNLRLKLVDGWSFTTSGRRNLKDSTGLTGRPDGQWISADAGLVFENECLNLATGIRRDFLTDRDILPNTSYMIRLSLKNIGM